MQRPAIGKTCFQLKRDFGRLRYRRAGKGLRLGQRYTIYVVTPKMQRLIISSHLYHLVSKSLFEISTQGIQELNLVVHRMYTYINHARLDKFCH